MIDPFTTRGGPPLDRSDNGGEFIERTTRQLPELTVVRKMSLNERPCH